MREIKYLIFKRASLLRKSFILANDVTIQSEEAAKEALAAAKAKRIVKAEKRLSLAKKQVRNI
jgi:hypothetical protein